MWLRRAFFSWLLPAAFLLPLWLFVGWIAFDAGGWAFLWILFIAVPSVFLGQFVLTLLTRARPSVRALRAVSWWDVAGYGTWHVLTIALGFFASGWWWPVMALAVIVGIGMFWLQIWQLWREARVGGVLLHASNGTAYLPPEAQAEPQASALHDVIVVEEKPQPGR